ncbi:flagellar brake protein [Fictibacillus phosphorivorans]|uniref:flagellar brake protein n=1 Tax=Fictibacillus phosphorivorans TaxID=1221500 RepID=UPI002040DDD8|nr:flagellar brake domain-containing protein [Fictibacillus phosphorivorans]MCM3718953.1 flagellar brake domain-containing protein [Fictibacillus phosphorivorans]MCM3776575.1 flagellar brake domain-containing protein [Fictibacillus phosphorivorans]
MIVVGEPLYLEPLFSNKKGTYRCKIYDVNDDKILIDYPSNETTNRTEYFFDGTQFKASFVDKEKNVFTFRTELLGRKMDKIPVLIMALPKEDEIQKLQRREYIRVETLLDTAVRKRNDGYPSFNSVVLDLSAGGMLLSLPLKHSVLQGDILECLTVLPMQSGEKLYLDLTCKVLRILDGHAKDRQKAPLQFISIDPKSRQHIIRFCFEQQLLMKKRESGHLE